MKLNSVYIPLSVPVVRFCEETKYFWSQIGVVRHFPQDTVRLSDGREIVVNDNYIEEFNT